MLAVAKKCKEVLMGKSLDSAKLELENTSINSRNPFASSLFRFIPDFDDLKEKAIRLVVLLR